MKGGDLISIKYTFWKIFKVRFSSLSFVYYSGSFTRAVSSGITCVVEGEKWILELLGDVVLITFPFYDIWANIFFNKEIKESIFSSCAQLFARISKRRSSYAQEFTWYFARNSEQRPWEFACNSKQRSEISQQLAEFRRDPRVLEERLI